MRLTIVSYVRSGRPRQLMEMKEKSRCSILFHLLVPGGKWLTRNDRPSLSASCCNEYFQARARTLLLPPASAVMKTSRVSG